MENALEQARQERSKRTPGSDASGEAASLRWLLNTGEEKPGSRIGGLLDHEDAKGNTVRSHLESIWKRLNNELSESQPRQRLATGTDPNRGSDSLG